MTIAPTVPTPQPARASASRGSGSGSGSASDGDAFARELAQASGGARRDDAGDRSRVGSRRDDDRHAASAAPREESRPEGATSASPDQAAPADQAAGAEQPAEAPVVTAVPVPSPVMNEVPAMPVTLPLGTGGADALAAAPAVEGVQIPATGVTAAVAATTPPAIAGGRGVDPSPAPTVATSPAAASEAQVAAASLPATGGLTATGAVADEALVPTAPAVPSVPAAASSEAETPAPQVLERVLAALEPVARDAATSQGETAQPVQARGAEPAQAIATGAPLQPTSPAPTAQPAAPASYAREVPVASQLSTPLASLKQLPQGEHEMQIAITPESFGHVRVVAKITPEGVSVQLFGSTEAGREALRAALSDLRRDLEDAGLGSNLDLGSDGGDPRDAGGEEQRARATAGTDAWPGASTTGIVTTDLPTPIRLDARAGGVDILL
ncbi:flagellar hook-length control protein FliK [Demequina gelatinilytica]|uniref:flagellar hook-length control protein FliK n=1 Tax=Demequina gelatinilytica TaxID=1638980 RepID=UPI000784252C|nr:flagellar hook-length control protein FliK [Demequina gelatinilytica]